MNVHTHTESLPVHDNVGGKWSRSGCRVVKAGCSGGISGGGMGAGSV